MSGESREQKRAQRLAEKELRREERELARQRAKEQKELARQRAKEERELARQRAKEEKERAREQLRREKRLRREQRRRLRAERRARLWVRVRRILAIAVRVVAVCLVVAFFVWAAHLRSTNERARQVERLRVEITDSASINLLAASDVTSLLHAEGLWPVGMKVDSVRLIDINRAVEEHCFVAEAMTFVDYDNTLTVRLSQRQPIVRLRTLEGRDFYLTRDMHLLPVGGHKPVDVPIVTGSLPLPWPSDMEGDLRVWARANKKNNDKNYKFLFKLLKFVLFTEQSPDYRGQIVQIELQRTSPNKEPRVVIVPREGNYVVELGRLGDDEDIKLKLERWQRFVRASVVDLNSGGTLSLAFDGQAVWRPNPKGGKSSNKR